jgi:phage tail-like protein
MRRVDDPLLAFRFVLELAALQVGGFTECTGLQIGTSVFEYAEGGRNGSKLKFPERGTVSNITLKRGLLLGSTSNTLFAWQHDVAIGAFDPLDNPMRRPPDPDADVANRLAIVMQNEQGIPVKRWRLVRAFPIKWSGPELKADSGAIAVESLEIACEGLEAA